MADTQKISVAVSYEDQEAFFQSGRSVRELIEEDTQALLIETRSLPPMMRPQELSRSTIDALNAIKGVHVQETGEAEAILP